MDAALLTKFFGHSGSWQGPCTVILNAHASVAQVGPDSFASAGAKVYAPRVISGRISADAVTLLANHSALLLTQTHRIRQQTGEDLMRQTLVVVDTAHIVALEFTDINPLTTLGIKPPPCEQRSPVANGRS
jgi:hypothetical protein